MIESCWQGKNVVWDNTFKKDGSTLQIRGVIDWINIMKVSRWINIISILLLCSCQSSKQKKFSNVHSSSGITAGWENDANGGAFQVTAQEYKDNFESRFGLLHLKTDKAPFTGRILTVDVGESGEYVSSDESWLDGRKNGKSSKWFTNGVKMYERNYNRGKWHGTVTRWWPNGQKMYVRAYSYGARHGKEATWRSDGTPIILPANGLPSSVGKPAVVDSIISQPEVENADSSFNDTQNDPDKGSISDSSEGTPLPALDLPGQTSEPELPALEGEINTLSSAPDDSTQEGEDGFGASLPDFPPMETSSDDEGFSPTPEGGITNDSGPEELPPFSPSDDSGTQEGLPPLPSMEEPESSLPPFPSEGDSDSLPPLPDDSGSDFGDLPPLPPLP